MNDHQYYHLPKLGLVFIVLVLSCCIPEPDPKQAFNIVTPSGQVVFLPPPYQTKPKRNFCKVIGWPAGTTPRSLPGFRVNAFAERLDNPRNVIVAPNGDVFVSEANTEISGIKKIGANLIGLSASQKLGPGANDIILLRDTDGDGKVDIHRIFAKGLSQPYGMLIMKGWFYIANTDGLWRYPYVNGQTFLTGAGIKILSLPKGGYNNHWTRNIRVNADSTKIFIGVGSGSNDGENGQENETGRAVILEINPDGTGKRIYASSLRNPNGLDIQPETKKLWTAVNERDGFGDDLVPDYLTAVREGGFYGWHYAYFGSHEDPNHKGEHTEMIKSTIVPNISLGAHTASLGLAFYTGATFPVKYRNGAFIGQHGSGNRSQLVGYKVCFVPFANGCALGKPLDFLTGFIADSATKAVYGRPVGIAVLNDGSLLIADDAGNKIWRLCYPSAMQKYHNRPR